MNELLIRGHLGTGDMLVQNAIVRHYAKENSVCVVCKHRNMSMAAFMWRDLTNVELIGVEDNDNDKEADEVTAHAEQQGFSVLRLGFTGKKPFDIQKWDQELYRQAGVDFKMCWNGFKVNRQPSREIYPIDIGRSEYCFVHEDRPRGYIINEKYLPKSRAGRKGGMKRIYADPKRTDNIFDWWHIIENATEIHVMESCFAILVDHLPEFKAKRVAVHEYCRKSIRPTYQNQFEIIDGDGNRPIFGPGTLNK